MTTSEPKAKTIHLDMGGGYACQNYGANSESTSNPVKVTCKTCLKTRAYVYYKIGYKRGIAKYTHKMTKAINPLLKVFLEGVSEETAK